MEDEIPRGILEKHPELIQISEAISAYKEKRPITVYCKTCGQLLQVTEVKAVGSIWVMCGNGCTRYHSRIHSQSKLKS